MTPNYLLIFISIAIIEFSIGLFIMAIVNVYQGLREEKKTEKYQEIKISFYNRKEKDFAKKYKT